VNRESCISENGSMISGREETHRGELRLKYFNANLIISLEKHQKRSILGGGSPEEVTQLEGGEVGSKGAGEKQDTANWGETAGEDYQMAWRRNKEQIRKWESSR